MPTNIVNQEYYIAPEGAQVTPADWAGLFTNIDDAVGWALALFGINDGLPPINPVTISLTGGLGITIGGSGQFLVCQGIVCDVCAPYSQTLAAADPTHPRIDLIAVKQQRVAGSQIISRVVRADSATLPDVHLSGTLVSGAATIALPAGYTSAPVVEGLAPVGTTSTGTLTVASISTTAVVIQSSDGADTRSFNMKIFGSPTGGSGASQNVNLYENHPSWLIVEGTPSVTPAVPATPSGYEAFAEISVGPDVTVLTSGMVTILFPTFTNLSGANIVNASNGSTQLPGGLIFKWGSAAGIVDNGATAENAVSFNAAFPNGVWQVTATVDTGSAWSGNELSAVVDTITTSGFRVTVGGGSGETCTIRWMSIGH